MTPSSPAQAINPLCQGNHCNRNLLRGGIIARNYIALSLYGMLIVGFVALLTAVVSSFAVNHKGFVLIKGVLPDVVPGRPRHPLGRRGSDGMLASEVAESVGQELRSIGDAYDRTRITRSRSLSLVRFHYWTWTRFANLCQTKN